MGTRISEQIVETIRLWASRNVPRRTIAKRLGIARNTVDAYVNDTHKAPRPEGPKLSTMQKYWADRLPIVSEYTCPGCGNVVCYSPCRECTTERKPAPGLPIVPLGLALKDNHRERYEALRAAGGGELVGCLVE